MSSQWASKHCLSPRLHACYFSQAECTYIYLTSKVFMSVVWLIVTTHCTQGPTSSTHACMHVHVHIYFYGYDIIVMWLQLHGNTFRADCEHACMHMRMVTMQCVAMLASWLTDIRTNYLCTHDMHTSLCMHGPLLHSACWICIKFIDNQVTVAIYNAGSCLVCMSMWFQKVYKQLWWIFFWH